MRKSIRYLLVLAAIAIVVAFVIRLRLIATGPPVAIIRVVDSAGSPVAGVLVRPEGLRTKAGPYQSGWYGWYAAGKKIVKNTPVRTAKDGTAAIPYPKYVFEKIETGVLCVSVDHRDFVPARSECEVDTTPPAGAPFSTRVKNWWERIKHQSLIAHAKDIVLKKGAVLRLSVRADAGGPTNAPLFAQVQSLGPTDTNSWIRPEPNVLLTRRLPAGSFTVRVVRIETNGVVWFSDVVGGTASSGQTNAFELNLTRGVALRGTLDSVVGRPIRNGRVIAHIWPRGYSAQSSPPEWHGWAKLNDDGEFEIGSLPPGDLEVVALCDGFVSTNGPGGPGLHYPQKHVLETHDLTITIGMESTARLEVYVSDDRGKPLKEAYVSTNPNVRYGDWSSTILGSDCYSTADWFKPTPGKMLEMLRLEAVFSSKTDSNGFAVLTNLPAEVNTFSAGNKDYVLPAIQLPMWGRKERLAPITLVGGETNRTSVQLEPVNRAPIAHY